VVLSWGTEPLAAGYGLYRHTVKDAWPPPLLASLLPVPTVTLPDVPAPPSLYFYRAVGQSCSGAEGP
jgi:hypothetical protein